MNIDQNVLAVINENIPIDRSLLTAKVTGDPNALPVIDAIYIPTLARRKNLLHCVRHVLPHTKNVYVLLSDAEPDRHWIERLSGDKVHLIRKVTGDAGWIPQSRDFDENPSVHFLATYDIPLKRNFALWHARSNNYRTIGLIDDDIVFNDDSLFKVRYLLANGQKMVGCYVLDFPDVSTIDHLERLITKKPSPVSIGGNFLFFKPYDVIGGFPYIYNDDWIFIFLNLAKTQPAACGFVGQLEHKPWLELQRVRFEQFGEVIISGFKQDLLTGTFPNTDPNNWSKIYLSYLNRLNELMENTSNIRFKRALKEALHACASFSMSELVLFANQIDAERRRYHDVS